MKLSPKLSSKSLKAVKRALKRRKTVKAKITLTAKDRVGQHHRSEAHDPAAPVARCVTVSAVSRRRVQSVVAVVLLLGALATAAALLLSDSPQRELIPGAGTGDDHFDPLAFRPERTAELERSAAAGSSQVLYAKSPGGATASARRTAEWRPEVESAARRFNVDADVLEAMVLLESAGRPDVVAGQSLESAVGLTQILAETAVNLLGMKVDLSASRRFTRRIAAAVGRGDAEAVRRLEAARRRADERFDPAKSLAATGRYLTIARERFGRDDLAVVSYHMGIGNLEAALRAYAEDAETPIAEVVRRDALGYARLFFDSTPLLHAEAHDRLARLGDDSATYLWRVLAAREIMRLNRADPIELARLQRLHAAKASAEEVLHPPATTFVFDTPADVLDARRRGLLVDIEPSVAGRHVSVSPRMGELAERLKQPRDLPRLAPRGACGLAYIGLGVEAISGEAPLTVTSAVRDRAYQRLVARRNAQATRGYSLHTTGYAFDVLRSYRNNEQARAFQFWLDRLQALNLIAWVREPGAIHVTVSSRARALVPLLVKGRVR